MWMTPELHIQSSDLVASPASRNVESLSLEALLNEALAMRPDLRATEIGIEAAGERAGLAQNQFMNLDAIYDANGSGSRGFESGPGLRFTVPIFNGNKGGIAIAEAQWQQAVRRYVTVRDQVTLDVRNAHTQVLQASENLATLQNEILPTLREAGELARRNYENGGTPYFLVLQTTGQYLDARLRELQLAADLRRAMAELDRSVGRKVAMNSVSRDPIPAATTGDDNQQTIIGRNSDREDASVADEVSISVQRVSHTSESTNSQSKGWHATPR
jgi:outer membrane protein, heavy metal efflux system